MAEKRKEFAALEESLARDLERSFREGWIYVGGDEHDSSTGAVTSRPLSEDAGKTLVGNLYTRFSSADNRYDFRSAARILNPAEKKLHDIEAELDLFDSQGDAASGSGRCSQPFSKYSRTPRTRTSRQTVRRCSPSSPRFRSGGRRRSCLTLAAALRGGAVYLEIPTAQGTRELFDYTESGMPADLFTKVNTFKGVRFRIAQTGLSVEELKAAAKLLVRLGVTDVPEAGNVIAARVREVGTRLIEAGERARTYAGFGLPLPEIDEGAETLCKKATTAKDPTSVVKDFLAHGKEWVGLHKFATDFSTFLADGRDKTFDLSRRLLDLCQKQPVPADRPEAVEIARGWRTRRRSFATGRSSLNGWPTGTPTTGCWGNIGRRTSKFTTRSRRTCWAFPQRAQDRRALPQRAGRQARCGARAVLRRRWARLAARGRCTRTPPRTSSPPRVAIA